MPGNNFAGPMQQRGGTGSVPGTLLAREFFVHLTSGFLYVGTGGGAYIPIVGQFDDQAANAVFAGPTTGSDAQPDFRALVPDDIPDISSVYALRSYVDAAVTGLLDLKGSTNCSGNPNYPAASKGDSYVVSVAGKIGGASGKTVEAGDVYFATADNAGGTEAGVGTSWTVVEHNLPALGTVATLASDTDGTLATNSDSRVATQKAVKTYVDAEIAGVSGGAPDYIQVAERRNPTTSSADSLTASVWNTRTLDTEISDAGNHCSLASNQITLDAGTYEFRASAPGGWGGLGTAHMLRLYNITDSVTLCSGQSLYINGTSGTWYAVMSGKFTIGASKAIELQHFTDQTVSAANATNSGENETYAMVELWKVG